MQLCNPAGWVSALLVLSSVVVARADSWTVMFPGLKSPVVAVPVGDGRQFVTVALPGAKESDGRFLSGGQPAFSACYPDPVSRVVVFRTTGDAAPVVSLRSSAPLGPSFPLHFTGGQAATTGWVSEIDGKILPLALLKILYEGSQPPAGTALLDSSGSLAAIAYVPASGKEGYAIPAEVIRHVLDCTTRDGSVRRARLGLALQPAPAPEVPRITRIVPDSPSSRAGIRAGDILCEVAGRTIGCYADAVNAFYFLRPDTTVQIRVRRDGQEIPVTLTPEAVAMAEH